MEADAYAPGKVILHGEHAVVYGTKAIAVSVGLNTCVKITALKDNVALKFNEVGIDLVFSLTELDELRQQLRGKGEFLFEKSNSQNPITLDSDVIKILEEFVNRRALIHCRDELKAASKAALEAFMFLYLLMFEKSQPIEVVVTTELPVGAGLGSSASYGVSLTGALLLSAGRMRKDDIDLKMVNRWAFASECFVHGNPSGIDNSVATFGGAVMFKKGDPLVHLTCSGIRVLLVNTEVPRSTKALVAKCAEVKAESPDKHEKILQEINTIVEAVITELEVSGTTSPQHVSRNQELLKELNVSHPKIDQIVDIARQHNFAAKLTGAGGGGCVFVMIPPGTDNALVDKLKSSLAANQLPQFWDITLGGTGFFAK